VALASGLQLTASELATLLDERFARSAEPADHGLGTEGRHPAPKVTLRRESVVSC